eukprot:6473386-Amphidinium_carterae.1
MHQITGVQNKVQIHHAEAIANKAKDQQKVIKLRSIIRVAKACNLLTEKEIVAASLAQLPLEVQGRICKRTLEQSAKGLVTLQKLLDSSKPVMPHGSVIAEFDCQSPVASCLPLPDETKCNDFMELLIEMVLLPLMMEGHTQLQQVTTWCNTVLNFSSIELEADVADIYVESLSVLQ